MTFRPWRIVTWQYKLLYIVVAAFFWLGLVSSVSLLKPTVILLDVLALVVFAFVYFWAVRTFRGTNEDYFAPRAWWRMTAKPTLSRSLGVIAAVLGVLAALGLLGGLLGLTTLSDPVGQVLVVAACAALAYLYLTSARRLVRETD
ncbi:hypothetical protein [Lacisediminihabitans changchengi]|uniref:Uncharacterized protein n=1 Tax=Lacisediminihabitans changchengi TaxID=2787634 RepID=A0A934SLP6_9MICO|nr:hypothetical protein [Lacisediminihabitans changchengi]MBK4347247.1 hypothetical protein [Lacisediminihabitans changchengi]